MDNNNTTTKEVYKYKTPPKVIAAAAVVGFIVVGVIVWGLLQMNQPVLDARMRGVIVEKRFEPFEQREQRITVGRGGFRQTISDGQYLIFVEVPQRGAEPRLIQVSMPDKESFDRWNVGDQMDVGHYMVK